MTIGDCVVDGVDRLDAMVRCTLQLGEFGYTEIAL